MRSEYQRGGKNDELRGRFFSGAGARITAEQLEFGKAMQAAQKRLGRFLSAADVLEVARSLGYRKCSQ